MAQSLFVSLLPKLPFSGCVNDRRGATAVKIPSAASSFSSGIFERCNKILVDDLHKTKPFSIIQEHRTKPFSLILPRNTDSKPQVLGSGFILWKNYISLSDQVEIVNICQEFGVGPWGFYQPSFQNGVKLRLHMMCFGISWDPRYYQYSRSHKSQDSPTSLIPDYLISLVETSIHDSQAHLNSELEIPIMLPDICIVSFYSTTGRRGFHQDLNETQYGIEKGWPVVSISIGDSAEFLYGRTRNMNKADVVLLESGDVLIFGGKSRDIYHGVKRIIPNSAPLALLEHTMLKPGRLNLSFRQF